MVETLTSSMILGLPLDAEMKRISGEGIGSKIRGVISDL